MVKVKAMLIAMILAIATVPAFGQDKVEGSIGTDLVSSYLWRGQQCAFVSLQPTASLNWKGLSLGAWGSVAIVPQDKFKGTQDELDISLSYNIKGFNVGVTDYFFADNGHPYFKHGGIGKTAHTFEGTVGYAWKYLEFNWYTNFAGNDGAGKNRKRAYSSYMQLDVPFHWVHIDWKATIGAVPYTTDFYAQDDSHGFHINQVALRAEYPIQCGKKFQLPVYAQLMANPSNRNFYYMFGFTINAL